jgi:hypothetical protein
MGIDMIDGKINGQIYPDRAEAYVKKVGSFHFLLFNYHAKITSAIILPHQSS